ncbi:hypothetical protein LOAG_14355 [Loa loa]|uniref:Uncharacterized protein n=1 Tax=Loa loa TaxID=7209 RepID=A0A1I7VJA4_LOALO|nr:hypothetical protein LOAG_14355 [Loa loa]EFO14169.2 hypothetical protein LOAG_14355 [Loa loa]
MAVETMLDRSAPSYYIRPIKVHCEPEITGGQLHRKERHECYREHREESQREYINEHRSYYDGLISSTSGDRIGNQISANYGSMMNNDGRRIDMR